MTLKEAFLASGALLLAVIGMWTLTIVGAAYSGALPLVP